MISRDLPEILALADGILVMRQGRISGELLRGAATEESVMHLAAIGSVTGVVKMNGESAIE
jgi:L-arabinose transport system ATP-binding protein